MVAAAGPKPAKSITLTAGKRVSVHDVVSVACKAHGISADLPESTGTADEGESGISATSAYKPEAVQTNGAKAIPEPFCRSIYFARLVSLMQGRSGVRAAVLQYMCDVINAGIVPCFTSAKSSSRELLGALLGADGSMCYSKSGLADAKSTLSKAGLSAPTLSTSEAASIGAGSYYHTGIGSILASACSTASPMVDVLSGLSCEAFGALTDPFEAIHFETNRQHRGQMNSATNLRLLLEGSKRTNKPMKKDVTSAEPFLTLPQTTGPAQDFITTCTKTLETELNSAESGPVSSDGLGFDETQAKISIDGLLSALKVLVASSGRRSKSMSGAEGSYVSKATLGDAGVQSAEGALEAYELVMALKGSFAAEIGAAMGIIGVSKGGDGEADASNEGNDAESKAKAAANKFKPEVDDSKMTPEQRAKAEAKRKLKAEKAAQKQAAKEAKKGSKGGIVPLGAGTDIFRNEIVTKFANTAGDLDTSGLLTYIDLFDNSEESFSGFCAKLLEQMSTGGKRKPKIGKGARDFTPEQMRIREQAFAAIRRVFKRHGGVEIDTPVFELKEVLTGKYGEDSKLIYDLADQGGELLSLRYDLTVPFARFLAMNSVGNIKRYHIAKVYRRDQPQVTRGRYREFYQCDFDVAGSYSPMVPDAEVLTVATEILKDLPVGTFMIKLNHRKLLDAIFEICGVPAEKFRPICSAVDKLDKAPWNEVKDEMVFEKGLDAASADMIGEFVLNAGSPKEMWAQLDAAKKFGDHPGANAAMADLKLLFDYLDAMSSLPYISFDLSLARGLDYYTGVIYEAVLTDGTSQVGSIAAGGRYDNLVGMFSPAGIQTPCVGVSIGIERVFTIMEKRAKDLNLMQAAAVQVFIASIGAGLVPARMKVAKMLWEANISAEYSHQDNPKFKKQLDEALERGIPYMVVFGGDEVEKGTVKVKDMREHEEVEVPLSGVVAQLMAKGCVPIPPGADLGMLELMRGSGARDEDV
jgi:histidyl-tRNA synthetase